MTKRQINIRIAKKEKEWEEGNKEFTKFCGRVNFVVKKEWKIIVDSMMYNKKANNKTDRFIQQVVWFIKIVFIFFFLKGLTYWLTGR